MAVTIQLYGQLRQIAGKKEITVDVPDTDQLITEMSERFPLLKNLTYLIAIDKTIIQKNTPIQERQEVALLPPYSGG